MQEILVELRELFIIAILCIDSSQVEAEEFRKQQKIYEERIYYGNSKTK